jgi:hypothetical protein
MVTKVLNVAKEKNSCRRTEHPDFNKQEFLEASELVAFDILEPALRSRGGITDRAKQLYDDEGFRLRMNAIFDGEPTGKVVIRNLTDSWKKIDQHEQRIRALENRLSELEEGR